MSGVQLLDVDIDEDGVRLDRWFKRRFPHVAHGRVEKLLRQVSAYRWSRPNRFFRRGGFETPAPPRPLL